jgi:uncharacterized protein with HEPN domain
LYMSKRLPGLLIEDIIESGNKILSYTSGLTIDQFLADDKTVDAVIRNFEIIGEATGNLPDDFKIQYPEIDWRRIKGFRNRIVHEYFGIDYEIVWKIKETFLPEILEKLSSIKK